MKKGEQVNSPKFRSKLILLYLLSIIIVGVILFLPAGTLNYWQAWIFIFAMFVPAFFTAIYFLKHDPALLQRRMQFKEKETRQKTIIKIADLLFVIGFLIPGFDYRYGWSNVPVFLVILSNIIIFLGYVLVFFVFKENSYTSRIIEVDKKQKVISTGPYSVIRHPMYAGIIPIFLFMSLALGSYIALIFFLPIVFLIIARILNEEKVLSKKLKGYKQYMKKVKYRLIPHIW
jgi:protein-S-isoprenylcysteine O-methyltransferase Ste14